MIEVNGQPVELVSGSNVLTLLEARGLDASRVAVERNGQIVRRADFGSCLLSDGDRIEIVHFVGGG